MLSNESLDYRQITKELDYSCKYSSPETLAVVRVLYDIRKSGLYDKKKVQKVIDHYARECRYVSFELLVSYLSARLS